MVNFIFVHFVFTCTYRDPYSVIRQPYLDNNCNHMISPNELMDSSCSWVHRRDNRRYRLSPIHTPLNLLLDIPGFRHSGILTSSLGDLLIHTDSTVIAIVTQFLFKAKMIFLERKCHTQFFKYYNYTEVTLKQKAMLNCTTYNKDESENIYTWLNNL